MNDTMQILMKRNGHKVKAVVTYHTPIHARGITACGMTFVALRAQSLQVHQTALNADLSDVNCTACKTSRAAYIRRTRTFMQVDGGAWRGQWLRTDGTVFAEVSGPDRDSVEYATRSRFGHFNHQDEADAFAELFRR